MEGRCEAALFVVCHKSMLICFRAFAVISIVQAKVFPYLGKRMDRLFTALHACSSLCGKIVIFPVFQTLFYELMNMKFLALPGFLGKALQLFLRDLGKTNR